MAGRPKTTAKTSVKTENTTTQKETTVETVATETVKETPKAEQTIKIVSKIRSSLGAFDAGQIVTVSGELAEVLIKSKRATKV